MTKFIALKKVSYNVGTTIIMFMKNIVNISNQEPNIDSKKKSGLYISLANW